MITIKEKIARHMCNATLRSIGQREMWNDLPPECREPWRMEAGDLLDILLEDPGHGITGAVVPPMGDRTQAVLIYRGMIAAMKAEEDR